MRKIYKLLIFLGVTGLARGQEINFSRVQDMTIWYNQSLKTDKQNSLDLNYRSVTFGGQIAYNSVAALFSMPLLSKAGKEKPNSGYLSFSAGAAFNSLRTGDAARAGTGTSGGTGCALSARSGPAFAAVCGAVSVTISAVCTVAGVGSGAGGMHLRSYSALSCAKTADVIR